MLLQSSGCLLRARSLLLGMSRGGLTHPTAIFVCPAARLEPLAIARAVPFEHRVKLAPIDLSKAVVLRGFVPGQGGIGNVQPQMLRLRRRDVDELLPQLIVRE